MPPTSIDSGTVTPTIPTESVLSTQTVPGTYVFVVDTTNMVAGDILELIVKAKVNSSASAAVIAFDRTLSGAQVEPLAYSDPLPIDTQIIVSLKQTAGTARAFAWNLLKM